MKTLVPAEFQVILFKLGKDFYALPITDVREVRLYEPLTTLLEARPFVLGMLNLRGRILPVLDLGQRLGKQAVVCQDKTRILIARASENWVGLLVDEVEGVATISLPTLQALPVSAQVGQPQYLASSVFELKGHLISLLDAAILLSESAERRPKIDSVRHKPKILIVDDSRTILMIFKGLFEKAGYDVLLSKDGEEGWQMALQEKPDVVILDGLLPTLDGFEICRRLRLDAGIKSSKILMFTGGLEAEETKQAQAAGADRFISKNTKPADILLAVQRLLEAA